MRSSRILGGQSLPAQQIFSLRNNIQMRRVDTSASAAEMVTLEAGRYRSDKRDKRNAMS